MENNIISSSSQELPLPLRDTPSLYYAEEVFGKLGVADKFLLEEILEKAFAGLRETTDKKEHILDVTAALRHYGFLEPVEIKYLSSVYDE